MLQIQDVEGEAVVSYREPVTTQEMLYHRLSRRVNNLAVFFNTLDITCNEFHKIARKYPKERILLLLRTFCRLVYATMG
jgi:hypothetical protein